MRSFLAGEFQPEFLQDELLHELFVASALRRPEHPALRCGGVPLSYAELFRRSTQTARYLRKLGVGRGERVAIWMPRGMDMYVAVLGVLQAGAAYVPLDPEYPLDRVAYVVRDSGARAIITARQLAPPPGTLPCHAIVFENDEAEMAACPREPVTREETGLTPDDCAYVIYTSGSTGRPKGVMISHRSICHLVRSEGSVLGLRDDDVVFQGFSLSFDMSLEEIWPAWAAGATLLVGTAELMRAGGDLAAILAREGLTAWTCVPTLLAMQETTVPTLRLLNLGGEACPPELVRRVARPGLRILNTYGPTEATITATVAEVKPDRPITIGRPLPNYTCHIVGENLAPVAPGEPGELCVGGPGLALGYVGRSDLTADKFIPNPFFEPGGRDPVIYRTGDLARMNADGEIEYLGRMDTQVKIRGFRVELSEIESVILSIGVVRNAVVSLHKDGGDVDILVAYLVPGDGVIDEKALRARLKERLPAYMVPSVFEMVAKLPTLPSGKVDRKNLPKPTCAPVTEERPVTPPATPTETALLAMWAGVFAAARVSVEDDFFLDLGGHSLRAAQMVSRVRKEPALRHISMVDVYNHPTIRRLAAHLDATRPAEAATTTAAAAAARKEAFLPVPWWRYWACAAAQAVSLGFIFAVYSLQWLIPYLSYAVLSNWEESKFVAVGVAMAFYILAIPIMLVIGIVAKWLVLGRLRPGEYPLWGAYYFRWWFVNRVLDTVPTHFLGGTPLMVFYQRLLGARIGRNVHLRDDTVDEPDCTEIGDDSSFSPGATLSCSKVENGRLKIGRVRVGHGCYVGANSAVNTGCVIGDGAEIEDLTMVPPGTSVPAGEVWGGSPARFVKRAEPVAVTRPARMTRARYGLLFGLLLFVFPLFAIIPIFPGMMMMAELDQATEAYNFLLLSPALAVVFVLSMCFQIALLKWLLVGRVRAGRHEVFSVAYVRHWLVDKLMELSLDLLSPLYATIYLNPWYRILGVKLGRRAEVSTASSIGFDTLRIGDESFIADGVGLGVPRVHHGKLEIEETVVGRRAFIGNSAVLPAGAEVGDGVLIGVLSVPPRKREDALKPDSSWFGTPAVFLPQRQTAAQFDEGSTFRPPKRLRIQRALIEFVRVILPLMCVIALTSMMMSVVVTLDDDYEWEIWKIAAVFPLLYLAYGVLAAAFVVALKWIVIGRYKPVEKPLWNRFVWRSELVTSTYENLAVPFFAALLSGTPFLPMYLRLLGCKIGRRVYMETTDVTEFDVVTIGDDAALNSDCGPQTHLFEDRVMKVSRIEIGARCTIGGGSIVLYDATMEDDSSLGELSLLMKGETLPAGTSWHGSPARPVASA